MELGVGERRERERDGMGKGNRERKGMEERKVKGGGKMERREQ